MSGGPQRSAACRPSVLLLLVLSTGLVSACEPAGREAPSRQRQTLADGAPALAPANSWRRFSLAFERAVSPRFSPSGGHLLVKGTLGIGYFVFSRLEGELVHAEDRYRGDVIFTSDGSICRGPREDARELRVAQGSRRFEPTGARCTLIVEDDRFGEQLHLGTNGAVYHDAFAGTVTRVSPGGVVTEVASDGPWNVAVSADGRRIAWARGDLSEPELTAFDPTTGAVSLGRGAHPTWSSSGRFLVFTRPFVTDGDGEFPTYDADLYVFDASTLEVTRLTDTPSVAEMQPVLAPDDESIAFADWQGGTVYIASITGLYDGGDRR